MKVPALSGNSELNFKRNIQFKDIFDLDEIQKLQDIFSEANQVASIISHPDGTPITKQSNFCKLCLMVIKKTENGGENCMKADSAFCAKGANGLSIGNCINSGLTNAVTRILVGGQHVANWVIGQVRTEQIDPQQIYQYADRLGIEREEFIKAWTEIPMISASRFEKISSMLFGFVQILSDKGYQNLLLKNQIAGSQKKAIDLEKSETSYMGLFNSVSEAIYVMSNDGAFLDVNDGAVKMYGHPREYLIGKTPADVSAPGRNDLEMVVKMLKAAAKGEPQEFEFWGVRSNGEAFPKEVRLTNGIYFGQEVVFALSRDITARKKAEEELERSEKRYRNIFSYAQVGIYIADVSGNFLTVNYRLVEILGYSSVAELMQKNIGNDIYWDKQERAKLISKYENVGNIGNLEICWKKKDGSQIWVDINAHPVKDESGTVIYFEGFVQDITQSKKSEQALKASESNLNALINNREEAIWSIDNEYRLVICNEYFKKAYKMAYNIDLFIGINLIENLPSNQVAQWKPKYKTAMSGKSITFQFEETIQGTKYNYQVYLNPIYSEGAILGVSALSIDITESIRTTNALLESERKMTTLVGNLPGMAYRTANDHNWTTNFISDSSYQITGYFPDDFINNKTLAFNDIILEKFRDEIWNKWQKVLSEKKTFEHEYQIRRADGIVRWVWERGGGVFNDKDELLFLEGYIEDITDRKEAELRINARLRIEELISDISATLNNANSDTIDEVIHEALENIGKYADVDRTYVFQITANGIHINNTHEWCRDKIEPQIDQLKNLPVSLFGYWFSKLNNFETLHIPCVADLPEEAFVEKRLLESQQIKSLLALPIISANTLLGFVGLDSVMQEKSWEEEDILFLQTIGGIFGSTFNRINAEKILKQSEEKFRNLVEGISEVFFITNARGILLYISPNIYEATGFPADELLGKSYLRFVAPVDREMVDYYYRKQITSDISDARLEFRYRCRDGSVKWAEQNTRIVRIEEGNAIEYRSILHNITQRKQAALELEIAKEKAEESDRLKSAFLANMSHEIRTPMNGILGFAELLKEPKLDGNLQREYIEIIEKSGMRMLNIINDIIDISKIESGQMKVVNSETNLNEEVEYIYKFFKPEVEEKGVQLSCSMSLPGKEALIQTDRDKIFSILMNLVKNAIKFTQSGSIDFGYRIKDEFIEFFVKDTGTGIPPDKIRVIFERFRQGSEMHNRNYEGAGLGLAISKAFVQMLGGKIWAESTPGNGSTFYFTIPFVKSEKAEKEIKEISDGTSFNNQVSNLKILVAEDDIISDLLITKAVKNLSKNILHAKTGIEAIAFLRENPDIDLVLMDIRMPEMDGYETTRQIRTFNQDVIIIAQTAFGLVGDKEKAIEAGCNDYVSKPINQTILLNTINKYSYKH